MTEPSHDLALQPFKHPTDGTWSATTRKFAYTHPVNGRVYKIAIAGGWHELQKDALSDCREKADYFLADKGDTIIRVGNWPGEADDGLGDIEHWEN